MITKKKFNSKYLFYLLQLVVMAFLFLILIDKQSAIEIQRFVQSLNINADIQSLMARIYLAFKAALDVPSCIGIIFVIMHVFCATFIVTTIIYFYPKRNEVIYEKVETPKYRGESQNIAEKYFHLDKVRLLN